MSVVVALIISAWWELLFFILVLVSPFFSLSFWGFIALPELKALSSNACLRAVQNADNNPPFLPPPDIRGVFSTKGWLGLWATANLDQQQNFHFLLWKHWVADVCSRTSRMFILPLPYFLEFVVLVACELVMLPLWWKPKLPQALQTRFSEAEFWCCG